MEEIEQIKDPKIKSVLTSYVAGYNKLAAEYMVIYSDRPDKMLTDENYRLKDREAISIKFQNLLRQSYQQLDSHITDVVEDRLLCCKISMMMDVLSYQCSRYDRVYNPAKETDVIDSAKRLEEIEKHKTFQERKVIVLKHLREDLDNNYLAELNAEIARIKSLTPEEQQQELMEYCISTAELKNLEDCSLPEYNTIGIINALHSSPRRR